MVSPPTRRKIGAIRRVQSERKGLNFWKKPNARVQEPMPQHPHMLGISQGVMQTTFPYPSLHPVLLFAPPLLMPEEEYFLARERLASFLRSEEPSSSFVSYSDSHIYESLVSHSSDLVDNNTEEQNIPNTMENSNHPLEPAPAERCATCRKIKLQANICQEGNSFAESGCSQLQNALRPIKSKSTDSIFTKLHKRRPYLRACYKIISFFRRRKPEDKIYQDIQSLTSASSFTNFKTAYSEMGDTHGKSAILKPLSTTDTNGNFFNKTSKMADKKLAVEDKSTQVSESELPKPSFSTLDPLRPTDKNNKSYIKHKTRSLVNLTGQTSRQKRHDCDQCTLGDCEPGGITRYRKKTPSWTSAYSEEESSPEEEWRPWTDNDSVLLVYQSRPTGCSSPSTTLNDTPDSANNRTCVLKSRQDVSSGLGSSGSDFSSEDGPTTQLKKVQNPSVPAGAKGHLKFDYSWSWNNLSNLVRTASLSGYDKSVQLEQYTPQIYV